MGMLRPDDAEEMEEDEEEEEGEGAAAAGAAAAAPAAAAADPAATVTCEKGHRLTEFRTPNGEYECDKCDATKPMGAIMWGCRRCDFDVCPQGDSGYCIGVRDDDASSDDGSGDDSARRRCGREGCKSELRRFTRGELRKVLFECDECGHEEELRAAHAGGAVTCAGGCEWGICGRCRCGMPPWRQSDGGDSAGTAGAAAPSRDVAGGQWDRLNNLLQKAQKYSDFVTRVLSVSVDDAGGALKDAAARASPLPGLRGEGTEGEGVRLKAFQRIGTEWLISLYKNHMHGILADEMGLGKTIMVIAFIAYLLGVNARGPGGVTIPDLIVVPACVLENWKREFTTWLPAADVTIYYGQLGERKALRPHASVGGVFLTTYEIAIKDAAWLRKQQWRCLIVDEAQRLKNFECRLIRELREVSSEHRLLLTGTPLQNNLGELWSILNFIMPQVFDDLKSFKRWFRIELAAPQAGGTGAGTAEGREDVVAAAAAAGADAGAAAAAAAEAGAPAAEQRSVVVTRLHDILRPFLLQRRKAQVAGELPLPAKKEVALYAPLSRDAAGAALSQRDAYGAVVKKQLAAVAQARDAPLLASVQGTAPPGGEAWVRTGRVEWGAGNFTSTAGSVTVALQKMCNHPMLFPELNEYRQRTVEQRVTESVVETDRDGHRICVGRTSRWVEREVGGYDEADPAHRARRVAHIVSASGKMRLLDAMLGRLREGGHKVLIFSQMTKMLDLIEEYLVSRGFGGRHHRIDGGAAVAERQGMIDDYNAAPGAFVFLLSTRAGGVGINLTSADTVIIYDSDWNPQNDVQAQARCHRIGQERDVVVYRLVTKGTVESYLLDRAERKLRLEHLVIEKGRFNSRSEHALREEEVDDVLRMSGADASFGDDALSDPALLRRLLDRKEVFRLLAEDAGSDAAAPAQSGSRKRARDAAAPTGAPRNFRILDAPP